MNRYTRSFTFISILLFALIASIALADDDGPRRRPGGFGPRPGGDGGRFGRPGGRGGNAQLPPATTRPVSYANDVQPILAESCYECHNDKKAKEGVRVNSYENLMKGGGEHGKLVIPGDSANSLLVKTLAGVGEKVMPPKEGPLAAEKISLIRGWIDQGAKKDEKVAARPADPAPAKPVDRPVSFAREIEPILANSCYECHGAKKQKAGLRLSEQQALMKGGDSGSPIKAGKSADSLLVKVITGVGVDQDQVMPPKERLTPEKIALIKAWIDQGAKFDQKVAAAQ